MNNLVETIVRAGTFTTLVTLLQAAGMCEELKGPASYTLFAPKDSAFLRLPMGTVDNLLTNTVQLRWLLAYHIVPGIVTSEGIKSRHLTSLTSSAGERIALSLSSAGHLRVNNARIMRPDIQTDNGIIHTLDSVMLPSSTHGLRAE